MTEFYDKPTRIGGFTSDGVSPGWGKVRLRLSLKDGTEGVILDLKDVFFLTSSPCNLVSLALLNNHNIFHDNKNETLHDLESKKVLAQAKRWNNSFLLQPLNLSDAAVNLVKTLEDMYQWPKMVCRTRLESAKQSLSTWHKRLGHLNLRSLRQYLKRLDIDYTNESGNLVCDSCQRAKATNIYNWSPQERAKRPYQFIHIDLVGPISIQGFGGERYFFTFTDDYTCHTETFTGTQKSDWFRCLKEFYNLAKTRSRESWPTKRLRSDYGSELQSKRVRKWLSKEGITFEPSAPYSQEQNGVSERTRRTIMDMTRATIHEGNIDDDLWPEIILAMTQVKNVRPTSALEGGNPHQALFDKPPNVNHLRVLGSTVYVFIHEEERNLKSEKFEARALKGTLVGYGGHKIYRVFIREQDKVIWVKDLQIFEDTSEKASTSLPNFEGKPTFEGFLAIDREGNSSCESDEITTNEPARPTEVPKSRSGRALRPTAKARERENSRQKRQKTHSTSDLIVELTQLLETNWEEPTDTSVLNTSFADNDKSKPTNTEMDPFKILAAKIIAEASAQDQDQFAYSTQFDIEEPETYNRAMSGSYSSQWSRAMREELDQLEKNNTWTLVNKRDIQPGHRTLSGKWVYKVKRDVNGDIARFKARWLVKGYLQQFWVGFNQTFAAVVKPMAFRVLFAIAAFYDLDIDQMDVKTAFLYGDIDQLLYVELPKGYYEDQEYMVCRLNKALYGLKQSPRLWYEQLSSFLLEKLGLSRINANHSIFITQYGLKGPVVSTFVDDIKIMGPKGSGVIERVKVELAAAFEMVDMGPISFYLCLKVERNREKKTIKLSQPAYIQKVLTKYHLDKANSTNTPMKEAALGPNLLEAPQAEKEKYQGMTGSLMFSMVETRPDIAFSIGVAARFAKNSSHAHTEAVKTILRYLKGSIDRGITYGGNGENLSIEGYSDSDWAGDKESRRSTSGFIFMLNGGPVSWCSKRQATVALSSTEAEYIALTLAAKEATWLRLLLTELGLLQAHD